MERDLPLDERAAPGPSPGSVVRAWAWAVVVLAASLAVLRVADAVPGILSNTARGVVRYSTSDEAERVIGRRLPAPVYFPAALAWPPGDVRVFLGGTAAYWCVAHDDGRLALVVAAAPVGEGPVAPEVLPPATLLQEAAGTVGGRPARVTRLRDADGALWQQVEWTGAHGALLARYRGTLDELMRIASSLRE